MGPRFIFYSSDLTPAANLFVLESPFKVWVSKLPDGAHFKHSANLFGSKLSFFHLFATTAFQHRRPKGRILTLTAQNIVIVNDCN
mmetsp:Transcript_32658/g.54713  ORF Transcript_32658/g.54713 Transcript_32658/m.54713 type:complete len:85 (-) Transcript_32658:1198-1452(-)